MHPLKKALRDYREAWDLESERMKYEAVTKRGKSEDVFNQPSAPFALEDEVNFLERRMQVLADLQDHINECSRDIEELRGNLGTQREIAKGYWKTLRDLLYPSNKVSGQLSVSNGWDDQDVY